MEDLKQLIERYGNMKGEMDSYKKQVDADNKASIRLRKSVLVHHVRRRKQPLPRSTHSALPL